MSTRAKGEYRLGALCGGGTIGVVSFGLILSIIAAWITHIIVAIGAIVSTTSVSVAYGLLLIAGVFVPRVGIIHGFGVWFGAW